MTETRQLHKNIVTQTLRENVTLKMDKVCGSHIVAQVQLDRERQTVTGSQTD